MNQTNSYNRHYNYHQHSFHDGELGGVEYLDRNRNDHRRNNIHNDVYRSNNRSPHENDYYRNKTDQNYYKHPNRNHGGIQYERRNSRDNKNYHNQRNHYLLEDPRYPRNHH